VFPVAWLTRADIVEGGLPTAPVLLPLIDLAIVDLLRNRSTR